MDDQFFVLEILWRPFHRIAKKTIAPPIRVTTIGTSPITNQTKIGAQRGSIKLIKPTCAEGTKRAPSSIKIKPRPTCTMPRYRQATRSCNVNVKFTTDKPEIVIAKIPERKSAGNICTRADRRTNITVIAYETGTHKAIKFPR